MSEKSVKQKKTDRYLIITIVIFVTIAVSVLLLFVLPDPISAAVTLREARDMADPKQVSTVVLTAPTERNDDLLSIPERKLDGEQAGQISKKLDSVLKNAKYQSTSPANTGVWKVHITVYNSNEKLKIYIDGNYIYLKDKSKLHTYKADTPELYSQIQNILDIE